MPAGGLKDMSSRFRGGYSLAARNINSVQIGSADRAPSRLMSRLSSYPAQAIASKFLV